MSARREALIAVVMLVLTGGRLEALGDDAEARRTLTGLPGVFVLVDVSDELRKSGLSEQMLKTDVELRLRSVGVSVPNEPGAAYLFVRVFGTPQATTEGQRYGFAASIRVSLIQRVSLVRDSTVAVDAETWYTYSFWYGTKLDLLRDAVKDDVDKFANAFLAANPKRSTERGTKRDTNRK